jgi:spoIIIJ-associated protein
MSGETEIAELEASGETIGEAKWQALRELERLHPGIDRDRVTFEVLAEGERGLLGVGTAPARVLARAELPEDGPPAASAPDDSSLASLVHGVVSRIAEDVGVRGRVEVTDGGSELLADVSGPEIGLIIGRNGRTIDAVQHVVSAIAHRAEGLGGRRVEVDAGGYRARRRGRVESTAQRAADRVLATGSPVSLEPMTSVERKLVHQALEHVPGVETRSEGQEPERYVVIEPPGAISPE